MANFQRALLKTETFESGWTVDSGGETYKGISWKAWKKDPLVQKIFDILRPLHPRKRQLFANPYLDNLISVFYKSHYWDKIYGDRIDSQGLAELIYDFYVNTNGALLLINKAIGARETSTINEDTLKRLNSYSGYCYVKILESRKNNYHALVVANPKKNKKYLNGWMARLNQFPKTLSA